MKRAMMIGLLSVWGAAWGIPSASAVTPAEDIATTIKLKGYDCGRQASHIRETKDAAGNQVIHATCKGKRYRVTVSTAGRVSVRPE